MQVKGKAKLIRYTADPEQTIALAAKLCYSGDEIDELVEKIGEKDNAKFIEILTKMNHFSPFEHASFTFAVEGVSRALLAQITRHRIASFSVRSQRYVNEGEFDYVIPPAIEALGEEQNTRAKWNKCYAGIASGNKCWAAPTKRATKTRGLCSQTLAKQR